MRVPRDLTIVGLAKRQLDLSMKEVKILKKELEYLNNRELKVFRQYCKQIRRK